MSQSESSRDGAALGPNPLSRAARTADSALRAGVSVALAWGALIVVLLAGGLIESVSNWAPRPVVSESLGLLLVLVGVVAGGYFRATRRWRALAAVCGTAGVLAASLNPLLVRLDDWAVPLVLFAWLPVAAVLALLHGPPRRPAAAALVLLVCSLPVVADAVRIWRRDALWRAVAAGDVAAVDSLLAGGAEVDKKHPGGITPLMRAVDSGELDIAGRLVLAGAEISEFDDKMDTPMKRALRRGDDAPVRLLRAQQRWWTRHPESRP
jgi:Ankyrin repeats (3 copies)